MSKFKGSPGGSDNKASPGSAGDPVWSLGWENPLEKEMATHSSTLAWKIPQMEEPGGLQSMGSQSQTRLSNFTFTFFKGHATTHYRKMPRTHNLHMCLVTRASTKKENTHTIILGSKVYRKSAVLETFKNVCSNLCFCTNSAALGKLLIFSESCSGV